MKVAFHAPLKSPFHPSPSGDRRIARMLIRALAFGGMDVRLASQFRSYDKGSPDRQARLKALGQKLAARYIRRHQDSPPDVWFTYHVYHKAPDWVGPHVARHFDIPYVLAEASHAPKRKHGEWDIGYRGAEDAIHQADLIFGLNDHDKACVTPVMKPAAKWISLNPFIDIGPFASAERVQENDVPVLLSVAMMRPGDKLASYRLLAQALAEIEDLPWKMVLIGDGEARADVQAAFAPLGERVVFMGKIDEDALPLYYANADLYLWPAINEAFGMSFLEAQAAGLPVIAGRTGGVPGVVAETLVPVGDVGAFAKALRDHLQDVPGLRTKGKAARARVLSEHSLAMASARITAELKELVP